MQVEIHIELACCFVVLYWAEAAFLAAMKIMCTCSLWGALGSQKCDHHIRSWDCNMNTKPRTLLRLGHASYAYVMITKPCSTLLR